MKKTKMKAKRKSGFLELNAKIIFYYFLMAIVLVYLVVLYGMVEKTYSPKRNFEYSERIGQVAVNTDKNVYYAGDSIRLAIKNFTDRSIFSEPCEYLNNFEKKINGSWVSVKTEHSNFEYDRFGFNSSKKITTCGIRLPESEGVYRLIVKIYYGCQKPELCSGFENFYSNEFDVYAAADEKTIQMTN